MKRIFLLLLSAAVVSAAFSCGHPSDPEEPGTEVTPVDTEESGPESEPQPDPEPEPVFVPAIELADRELDAGAEGGSYEIHIKTNIDYTVTADESCREWITLGGTGTPGDYADTFFVATIAPNDVVAKRSGKIYVDSSLGRDSVLIVQKGVAAELSVSVSSVWADRAGDTLTVSVKTNLDLSVASVSWLEVSPSDSGYTVKVQPNNEAKTRTGRFTIFNNEYGKSAAVTVNQKAAGTIYILAIGNSFSWDAMEYLYPMLSELGYTDIFLGNLYIGGCTLQTHASHITSGAGAYQYRTNSSGTWGSTDNYSSVTALKSRPWDYVSVQQASGYSGVPDSFDPYLGTIVSAVRKYCPEAALMWHMTWAYQGNSTHSDFVKYDYDQLTMYQAILGAVQEKVLARGDFDFVIPCGTAVQNLRTSLLGDTVTRDGYHMSYDYGRTVTALMWARQISGKSISGVTYKPSGYTIPDKPLAAMKEAVENAWSKPYSITESSCPPVYSTVTPDEDLWSLLEDAGYDKSAFEGLPLQISHNAYYNSTGGCQLTSAERGSTATNLNQFAATQIFNRRQLPEGSVMVLKPGYQYRHEGWTALTSNNSSSSRPGEVSAVSEPLVVKVDSGWWGSWYFRAFNLAKYGKPALDAAGQAELDSCFGIFVPKN